MYMYIHRTHTPRKNELLETNILLHSVTRWMLIDFNGRAVGERGWVGVEGWVGMAIPNLNNWTRKTWGMLFILVNILYDHFEISASTSQDQNWHQHLYGHFYFFQLNSYMKFENILEYSELHYKVLEFSSNKILWNSSSNDSDSYSFRNFPRKHPNTAHSSQR